MILETKHLLLRQLTKEDLNDLTPFLANKDIAYFSLRSSYKEHSFGLYAIVNKENHKLIGCIGLVTQPIDNEEKIELAYLLDPSDCEKEYIIEATTTISHYAFDQLGIQQLISIIDPKNIPAIEFTKRLGMHLWKKSAFRGFFVHIYALNKLSIEPFQKQWALAFLKERDKLIQVFKELPIDFYHIGSTSIPECAAKPIIDILGVTPDVLLIDQYHNFMEDLGYHPLGEYGMKQRRFFRKRHNISVNVHIFEDTDPEVERHLRFRNYLRDHPEKTKKYSQLKASLAKQFPGDIAHYILGKEKFIKEIDILAAEGSSQYLCQKNLVRKKKWSSEEILKAIEVNMHLQMTYFAKYRFCLDMIFEQDVTILGSSTSDITFNYALSARFTDRNVKERITHVSRLYENLKQPFSWWVGPLDTPHDLNTILISQGFILKEEVICLYRALEHFTPSSKGSDLYNIRILSLSQLNDFSDTIYSSAYKKIYNQLPSILYQEGSSFEIYAAYFDNTPVAIAILVLHANIAGVYLATASVPIAMIDLLLTRAKSKGYYIAMLQVTTPQLADFYENKGFKKCCTFKNYSSISCL